MSVVVDASIACKWFFEEERTVAADRILAEEELIAPELIYIEVGNVVWKRVRQGKLEAEKARAVMSRLTTIPFQIADARILLPIALDIAMKYGRTIYDSSYVALAVIRGCQVVTADERLFNSLARTELGGHVRLL